MLRCRGRSAGFTLCPVLPQSGACRNLCPGFPRWSGSVDPSTPTARTVGVLPTEPGEMIPAAAVRVLSTAAQTLVYHYGLRLVHHPGVRPAPYRAGATAVAADPDSPSLAPRSVGNDLREANARSAAHPSDRSSACELARSESLPRFLSTTSNWHSATNPGTRWN